MLIQYLKTFFMLQNIDPDSKLHQADFKMAGNLETITSNSELRTPHLWLVGLGVNEGDM